MYKINTQERFQNTNNNNMTNMTNMTNSTKNTTYNYYDTMINEDTRKMHLIPPHCPMTPKSYTDFFNDSSSLSGVAPYKMETVKHPKQGYKESIEYRNFYSDFKKDALEFTSKNNVNEFSFINKKNDDIKNNKKNNKNNKDDRDNRDNRKPIVINEDNNYNIKLYNETKPHTEFAKPMMINGSNKVSDLFDNCMNKKTFDYKRYSQISPHHKQWIDNPLFVSDISKETSQLKNNYMNDREIESSNIYSSIFEDMYFLTYNAIEYTNSAIIQKILNELK